MLLLLITHVIGKLANRLTKLEHKKTDGTVIASYEYPASNGLDAVGNRKEVIKTEPLSAVLDLSTTGYIYNDKKNRLLSDQQQSTFGYDDEGHLNTGYGSTYQFDYEHRLKTINTTAYQYFYDGKGNRLKAIRNGVTTYYVYDMNGNVLAEANGTKTITRLYIQGQGLLAAVTPTNNQVYTYHFNPIGTTAAITDQGQNIVNKYAYDSFGTVLEQQEAAFSQPFKYVGQYGVMAEPNGFYYMRARYYDPKVGRFISEDPIGFEGGLNLYEYVGSNPVTRLDPEGLAYFAKRPLRGFFWLGQASCSPGSFDDIYNTEVSHEQLFFEDGKFPQNIGFFDDGTLRTEPNPTGYRCNSGHYDDCLMRKAVQKVGWRPYSLLGGLSTLQFNCQDWADLVRAEYDRVAANPKSQCECAK